MYESNVFISGRPLLRSETCGDIRIPENIVRGEPGSDPEALLAQLPPQGGIIHLAPGDYWMFGLGSHTHDCVAIIGETGPDGRRPIIHGPIWGSYRTGQVVYLANVEVDGDQRYESGITVGRHYRSELYPCLLILDNVYLHDFLGNGLWPHSVSFLELHNVELARNGAGNYAHNIYAADEIDGLVIRGGHYHSAKGSHAFKSKARRMLAVGATFETTNRWREYLENPALADTDSYFSTTLLDSVGNAQHNIVDCTFNFWKRSGTGDYIFDMQRRKTGRYGCDDPPYLINGNLRTYLPNQGQVIGRDLDKTYPEPVREGEFWDTNWWLAARAAGQLAKLVSRIWRCAFNVVYFEGALKNVYAVHNVGTLPVVDNGAVGFYDYPVPEDWWERSEVLIAPSCTYTGIPPENIAAAGVNSNRPLIPNHRRNDPLIDPRIRVLPADAENEARWRDQLPPFGEWSRWKHRADSDRNLAIMRERFPL